MRISGSKLDVEPCEKGGSKWVQWHSGVILAIPFFVIPIPLVFQMFHKVMVMLRDKKLAFTLPKHYQIHGVA